MVSVKFYLDKADKNKRSPIHLVLRQKEVQIKVATGEKICKKDWIIKTKKLWIVNIDITLSTNSLNS
jgi:hypothetical protein